MEKNCAEQDKTPHYLLALNHVTQRTYSLIIGLLFLGFSFPVVSVWNVLLAGCAKLFAQDIVLGDSVATYDETLRYLRKYESIVQKIYDMHRLQPIMDILYIPK